MKRASFYLFFLATLSSVSFAAPTPPPATPVPPFPEAAQTPTWTASTNPRVLERLPTKSKEFEKAFGQLIKESPEKIGLPAGVVLRVDSIQQSPEADGIPPMAFIHLTQTVDGTPVAGTETAIIVQWNAAGSPMRVTSGRLYTELKKLPEKPVSPEEAERKVWEKLSTQMTRFETTYGGVWVRWIDGRWRTIQLYGVTPQALLAAVDGTGNVVTWSGHLATPVPTEKSEKSPKK